MLKLCVSVYIVHRETGGGWDETLAHLFFSFGSRFNSASVINEVVSVIS